MLWSRSVLDNVDTTGATDTQVLAYNAATSTWKPAAATVSSGGTVTGVSGTAPIVSSGGTAPAISITAASGGSAGSMSAADFSKLSGIAAGATVNQTDAYLLSRTNHTGTQTWATITSTPTTRAGYGITDAEPTITAGTTAQY